MNLPAPTIHQFPPRHQVGKSWLEIAAVFDERADRERKLAWEKLATGCAAEFHRHIARSEALAEAAATCRAYGTDLPDTAPHNKPSHATPTSQHVTPSKRT